VPFGGLLSLGVSAGSSLIGGLVGGNASADAAKQQAAADQKAIDFTKSQVSNSQNLIAQGTTGVGQSAAAGQGLVAGAPTAAAQPLSPYTTAGATALPGLQDLSGANGPLGSKFSFDPSNLAQDPGYQFTLQQGQQAIQRAAAAQGGLFSGGTMKSLAGYTTGTANQYFNDAYQRSLSTFQANQQSALNRAGVLSNLAGYGYGAGQTQSQQAFQAPVIGAQLGLQGATTQLQGNEASGQLGVQGASSIAQMMGAQGNAQAAGTVGSANSWLNALQGGTNSIIGYLGGNYGGASGNGQQIGTLDRTIATQPGPPIAPPSLLSMAGYT
jgi:hypothetical protein